MQFWKLHKIPLAITFISILLYFLFAYPLERTDYILHISLYSGLFLVFYILIKLRKDNLKFLTWVAFVFRAIFILAIPNLSQDFYRFIWDGRMILEGFNPYLYTPESFISQGKFPIAQAQELYNGMQSLNASHFTNYPPLNQLCFIIAGVFSGNNILGSAMVLRLIIITADFGTLHFGRKLLKKLNLPEHNIFWYILNPFIIIELTGNLHFEGVMIFFLVWSLYLLYSNKWKLAAVVLGCSISVKLIPLLFLPLFFQWFMKRPLDSVRGNSIKNTKNGIATSLTPRTDKTRVPAFAGMTRLISFYSIVGITTLLLFAPFFSTEFLNNYAQTVGLWFGDFEFNASIYYVARAIGYLFRGYNEIAIIGKILPVLILLIILGITFFRKNKTPQQLITAMLLSFTVYLFLSTTVHPWYIATLLILSVFTNYKFSLVWSFTIILSYLAYTSQHNSENLWIIFLEYTIVISVMVWEFYAKKKERINVPLP